MCAAFMQRGSPIRLGANAQQAKTKIIVMELFSHIGLNDWTDGSLIQWVPQNMLETRVGAETEKGLINFGNLIANDVTKWPVYKHNLEQCKSKDKSFAYERPTSPTNWTSFVNGSAWHMDYGSERLQCGACVDHERRCDNPRLLK
jgi:hypothetical protein